MERKTFKNLGKIIMALAVVICAVVIANGVRVHADNGETVRVTNAKELTAAMKNAEVGTIILRTQVYQTITIKANKASKNQFLIIDAPNTIITNKAVFANINIINAQSYTESASGNKISLSDAYIPGGFTVAKKKKLSSLTVYDMFGTFSVDYTLRKGAKLGELNLVYAGDYYPVESTFNKKKKTTSLDFTAYDGCERKITVKLDKNGRVSKFTCDSDWVECTCEYTYKYDKNGNITKMTCKDNMSGTSTYKYTYKNNFLTYMSYIGDVDSGECRLQLDDKGRVLYSEYNGKASIDGEEFTYTNIEEYEYDAKGRKSYQRWETPDSGYFSETVYTYDSKGFLTDEWTNNSGIEQTKTYTYSKKGDKLSETYTSEGYSDTIEYAYDELGYLIEQ